MDDPFAIKDIAPPVEFLPSAPLWPWVLLALIAIGCALYFKFLHRPQPTQIIEPDLPAPTPLQNAISALDELMEEQLIEERKTRLFFTRLNMILRVFLMEQFKSQSLLQTTSEMITSGAYTDIADDNSRTLFESFLRECDLFKFADIAAQPDIAKRAHNTCRELITALAPKTEDL